MIEANSSPQCGRPSVGVRADQFPEGSVVEVFTDEDGFQNSYFTATVISTPNPPTSLPKRSSRKKSTKKGNIEGSSIEVEYHNLLAGEDREDRLKERVDIAFVRPEPPKDDNVKDLEAGDVVDAFYKDGWWKGVVSQVKEGGEKFVVTFQNPPDELEFGVGELRFHRNWVNGNWSHPQKREASKQLSDDRVHEYGLPENPIVMVDAPAEIPVDGKGTSDEDIQREQRNLYSNGMITPPPNFFMNNIPMLFDSQSLDIRGEILGADEVRLNNAQIQQGNEELEVPIVIGLPCFGTGSPGLSKGRKSQSFKTTEVAAIVNDPKQSLISSLSQNIKDSTRSRSRGSSGGRTKRRRRETRERTLVESGRTPVSVNARNKEVDSGDLSKKADLQSSLQVVVIGTEGMVCTSEQYTANGDKHRDGIVINDGDEIQPSASVDKTVMEMIDENIEKQQETGLQPPILSGGVSTEESGMQDLPFTKNAGLWEIIESMEVFQKIPQKPHFQPLERVEERSHRESLALSLMIEFASLVETTSKLKLNHPKHLADNISEAVKKLDRHGFDVRVLQLCLSEFLEVKDEEEQLIETVNNLTNQIVERDQESTRIEEQIREMNEQITKLQEQHSVIKSAKEKLVTEVASLDACIDTLRRNFKAKVSEKP